MSPSKSVVLLITHSEDHFTVDRVAEALRRRGVRPYRLDTDRFPTTVRLSVHLQHNGAHHTIDLRVVSIRHQGYFQPTTLQTLVPRA